MAPLPFDRHRAGSNLPPREGRDSCVARRLTVSHRNQTPKTDEFLLPSWGRIEEGAPLWGQSVLDASCHALDKRDFPRERISLALAC